MAGLMPNTAMDAVSWALAQTQGEKTWPGLCDRFVANVYGQAHSGYDTALVHWAQTPQEHKGTGRPPVGALVYFKTGKPAGHVAVVTGYDDAGNAEIVTTHVNGGKPTKMPLSASGLDYIGWATPYFQGRVAELDSNATGGTTPSDLLEGEGMDVPSYRNPGTDPRDLNGDGKVNKKDETLRKDNLSMQILGRDYEFASRIVGANPELKTLFKRAIKEGWSKENFEAALQGTKWYSEQGSDYARKAWFAKQAGGGDWQDQLKMARDTIQRTATQMGVTLSGKDLDAWAERYITEGWYDSSRQGLMQDALAERLEINKGAASQLTMSLTQMAQANGIRMTNQFFSDAAKSIAKGESTQADWENYIREQAAAKFPMYSDKIKAGVNARDLASPYISRMAELLEMNPDDVTLDDPYIKQAMSGIDEQGNPKALGYADFETMLRRDPRWQNTTNGKRATMGLVSQMMRDWGFAK